MLHLRPDRVCVPAARSALHNCPPRRMILRQLGSGTMSLQTNNVVAAPKMRCYTETVHAREDMAVYEHSS